LRGALVLAHLPLFVSFDTCNMMRLRRACGRRSVPRHAERHFMAIVVEQDI
jgi:hypothetical protein